MIRKTHFFADAQYPLYGVYHPANERTSLQKPILICGAHGQEAHRSHRLLTQIADFLALRGYPVLRFDYHNNGDSSDIDKGPSLQQYRRDIVQAGNFLRRCCGQTPETIIGLRLGASLALQLVSEGLRCHHLVLCDPIVNGKEDLLQLESMHQKMLLDTARFHTRQQQSEHEQANELLGFPCSAAFRQAYRAINLQTLPFKHTHCHIDYIANPLASHTALAKHLLTMKIDCQFMPLEQDNQWHELDALELSIIGHGLLDHIRQLFTVKK